GLSPFGLRNRFEGGPDFLGRVIDPGRTRQAFETSAYIRRLWPATLLRQTLPFFASQRIINRVLLEGANPLRQIEDLHFVLTQTPLQILPLWILGLGNH